MDSFEVAIFKLNWTDIIYVFQPTWEQIPYSWPYTGYAFWAMMDSSDI